MNVFIDMLYCATSGFFVLFNAVGIATSWTVHSCESWCM